MPPVPFQERIMIVYENIYLGFDALIAEQQNLLQVVAELEKAKRDEESFILMSSPFVFDLEKPKHYSESDVPNSNSPVMKLLSEAEKLVLAYDRGYVFRSQSKMSFYSDLFRRMADFVGVPVFHDAKLFLLADEAYDFLFEHYKINAGDGRIVHLATSYPIDVQEVWFRIRGFDPVEVDSLKSPTFDLVIPQGVIRSSVIQREPFYKDFTLENRNSVRRVLKSFGV